MFKWVECDEKIFWISWRKEKNKTREILRKKIVYIKLEPRQINLFSEFLKRFCNEMDGWNAWDIVSKIEEDFHPLSQRFITLNDTAYLSMHHEEVFFLFYYFCVNRQIMAYFFPHYHALNSIYLIT